MHIFRATTPSNTSAMPSPQPGNVDSKNQYRLPWTTQTFKRAG